MSGGNQDEWEPYVTDEMEQYAEQIQDRVDNLINPSNDSVGDPYSILFREFEYRMEKIEEEDPDNLSELIKELLPYIATTAAAIESMSTVVLIYYLIQEDLINDDPVFQHFNRMTQGQRGQLLDALDLLPDNLSEDMEKFNQLRNIVIHEYQSHQLLHLSSFNQSEFGDALLAGIRSAQGLHGLMDMYVPDSQFL